MNTEGMTAKQISFANHVVDGENLTEARRLAGYSQRMSLASQWVDAQKLRHNPKVSLMIEAAQTQIAKALAVSREDVARELELMGFARLTDLVEWDGGSLIVKDTDDVPERALAALSKVTQHTAYRDGEAISSTLRVELTNKVASLEALSKLLGFDKEQPASKKRVKVTRMTVRATETTMDSQLETVEVEEGVPPMTDGADPW